jgi:lysophospholipase L1-like esterase
MRRLYLSILFLTLLPGLSAVALDVPKGEFENPAEELARGVEKVNWSLKGDATFGWRMGTLGGDIEFNGRTLKVDTGGGNDAALTGALRGKGNLIWIGGGTSLQDQCRPGILCGAEANSLLGTLTLTRGTLALAKPPKIAAWSGTRITLGGGENQAILRWDADHQVVDGCDLLLRGPSVARLWLQGHAETLGRLALQGDGEIRLGGEAAQLRLADSAGVKWLAGAELMVRDWNGRLDGGGNSRLVFGQSASALSAAQVASVGFANPAGLPPGFYHAMLLPDGELVPKGTAIRPRNPPFEIAETAKQARRKMVEQAGRALLTGKLSALRGGTKIAFFGDSITWMANGPDGQEPVAANPVNNFNDSGAYYDLIGRALQEGGRGGVTLTNHALNGGGVRELHDGREHTGDQKDRAYQPSFAKLLDAERPSVVVIFVGVNDAGWRQTEPGVFRSELAAMAAEAAASSRRWRPKPPRGVPSWSW